MSNDRQVITIDDVRPIIATKVKQYEKQLASIPEAGVIRPVGIDNWLGAVMADFARPGKQGAKLRESAMQAPETVWNCLSHAASVGLIPGSAAGKFYLIPRWSGQAQRVECTHIVGYKGLIELAYRSPRVHKVEAFLVMSEDEFSWRPGGDVNHRLNPDCSRLVEKDLSNIRGAYARVVLTVHNTTTLDPEPVVEWMTRDEILEVRGRSESVKKGTFSPWDSDPGRMARKCPLRRSAAGGSMPQSDSLQIAIANENSEVERLDSVSKADVTAAVGGLRDAVGLKPRDEPKALPEFTGVEEAIEFAKAKPEMVEALADQVDQLFAGEGDREILKQALVDLAEGSDG